MYCAQMKNKAYRFSINDVLAILIYLLPIMYADGTITYAEPYVQKELGPSTSLARAWNAVAPAFMDVLGTTQVGIESTDRTDFERLLGTLCIRNDLALRKASATIANLVSLPKPLLLVNRLEKKMLSVVDVVKLDDGKMYQICSNDLIPRLYSARELTQVLAYEFAQSKGDVLWIEGIESRRRITHEKNGMTLELDSVMHNFGVVYSRTASAAFHITNPGKEPILIESVKTTCNCTVVKDMQGRLRGMLAPGDETQLTVSVNLAKKNSFGFHYPVIINYSDEGRQRKCRLRLDLIGNYISYEHTVIPSGLSFKNVLVGKTAHQTLSLIPSERYPVKQLSVLSSNDALKVRVAKEHSGSSKLYRLNVEVDDNLVQAGKVYEETIILDTGSEKHRLISIPVTIQTCPLLTASPSMVVLGIVKAGDKVSKQILVSSPYSKVLSCTDCNAPDNVGVKYTCENGELRLIATAKLTKVGTYKDTITLLFDKPEGAVIKIPIYGIVTK